MSPSAVTLGSEIERFGSYFGIAAIIGLGVLALLYFAQAREIKRLREWAGRAPERDAELAQRVQAGAQRRVVAQPAPAPAAGQPAGPQTAAAQQADAARKAAAATVMQKFQPPGGAAAPVSGPPGQLARTVPAAGAPGTAGAPAAATGPAASGASGGAAPSAGAPGAAASGTAPAPAGAVDAKAASGGAPAGAAGAKAASGAAAPASGAPAAATPSGSAPASAGTASGDPSAPSAPATKPPASAPGGKGGVPGPAAPRPPASIGGAATAAAAAAAAARQAATPARSPTFDNGGGSQDTHESSAARPAPLPELPRRPSRTAGAPPSAGEGRGRGGRRLGLVFGGVAAVLVVGIVIVLLTTSGDKPTAGNSIGATPAPAGSSSSTRIDRKATQVAVLNGTTQTGLARGVGNKLQDRGFTILSVGDNADQQIATTTVSYAAGKESAARVVARIVGVTGSAVKPIDTNTATAVAPEASVVVTVGNDRSSTG